MFGPCLARSYRAAALLFPRPSYILCLLFLLPWGFQCLCTTPGMAPGYLSPSNPDPATAYTHGSVYDPHVCNLVHASPVSVATRPTQTQAGLGNQ